MFKTALSLAAALLDAQAGDWRVIMTASDGTATLVDGASIRRVGPILTFWQKDRHSDGTVEGARIRLDCKANTWQVMFHQNMDAQGRVVSTLPSPMQPQEIRLGSAMEEERDSICPVLVRN